MLEMISSYEERKHNAELGELTPATYRYITSLPRTRTVRSRLSSFAKAIATAVR